MIIYILRKIATGAVVFFSVTALTFALFHAQGGDVIAQNFTMEGSDAKTIHATAERLGLLRPIPVQYVDWLGDLFTGTMGYSFASGQAVSVILVSKMPVTVSLVVMGLLLTVVTSLVVGVAAATRGGIVDRALQILSVIVNAIPGYWLALILVIIFGLTLRLVPATGYIPITESFTGWLSTIILPSISIAIGSFAFVAMQIRGALLDVLRQDYIRTLRTRGISQRSILLKHALRNIAGPSLTILSLQVIGLLGGAVLLERIYALPGLGSIALSSGTKGDIPVVVGTVAFMVVVVVVVNLLTDILNGILNPKARIS
jgi:peptide/nickel transport system permease protein